MLRPGTRGLSGVEPLAPSASTRRVRDAHARPRPPPSPRPHADADADVPRYRSPDREPVGVAVARAEAAARPDRRGRPENAHPRLRPGDRVCRTRAGAAPGDDDDARGAPTSSTRDEPGRGKITFTNTSTRRARLLRVVRRQQRRPRSRAAPDRLAGGGDVSGVRAGETGPHHREDTPRRQHRPRRVALVRRRGHHRDLRPAAPAGRRRTTARSSCSTRGTYQMSVGIYVFEATRPPRRRRRRRRRRRGAAHRWARPPVHGRRCAEGIRAAGPSLRSARCRRTSSSP